MKSTLVMGTLKRELILNEVGRCWADSSSGVGMGESGEERGAVVAMSAKFGDIAGFSGVLVETRDEFVVEVSWCCVLSVCGGVVRSFKLSEH